MSQQTSLPQCHPYPHCFGNSRLIRGMYSTQKIRLSAKTIKTGATTSCSSVAVCLKIKKFYIFFHKFPFDIFRDFIDTNPLMLV